MNSPVTTSNRRGFTLVELLVVIAIIGVLVALLLPAIQAAREAARRSQCSNNLKQQGLGALNYESARKVYPAGVEVYRNPSTGQPEAAAGDTAFLACTSTWAIDILPHMEQQQMQQSFDTTVPISAPVNRNLITVELPAFICPSDPGSESYNRDPFARSSYDAVAGVNGGNLTWGRVRDIVNANGTPTAFAANDEGLRRRGVLTVVYNPAGVKRVSGRMISDGTSNTVMLAEYHTQRSHPAGDPNNNAYYSAWGSWRAYTSMASAFTTPDQHAAMFGLPDYTSCTEKGIQPQYLCELAVASLHSGGVIQCAYADGHVDQLNSDTDRLVWQALATMQGGEVGAAQEDTGAGGGR